MIPQHSLIRLWAQISNRRRKQLLFLLVLTFFTSLTEVVSIGAVIPFLAILSGSELVVDQILIEGLIEFISSKYGENNLLLSLTVLFVISAFITGLMRIILLWTQTKLAHAIGADLNYQVYYRTLHQPFSIHVARNSSEVIAGISTKVNHVVGQVILPILIIVNSIFVIISIMSVLILIDPFIAITSLLTFAAIYLFFIKFTRQKLALNSQKISQKTNLSIKTLQEGLGGIRDTLIDGTQSTYCKKFRSADITLRKAMANNQIISQSPRYVVESLGIIVIVLLAYNLGTDKQGVAVVLPVLGALALGAQRILPLLQNLYSSWSKILGSRAVLDDALILIEQKLPSVPNFLDVIEKISFKESIELKRVSFRYLSNTPLVLNNISLKIAKGAKVGIVGTTGSGKSTLIDLIMSLLSPSHGSIFVDNVKINFQNQQGWQSHISHIPQNIFLSDASVYENIAFGIPNDQIDFEKVKRVASQAQIHNVIVSWAEGYDTVLGENGIRLSGGQRQRIGIARALYKTSDLIILDEATSALDDETERRVMDAIDCLDQNITVIIVAHRTSTLKNCDQIILLENGKVVSIGSYSDIIDNKIH